MTRGFSSADDPRPLDPRLLEALDACRPATDDFADLSPQDRERFESDPRYASWLARSAEFDAAVARAYDDVPVPTGMSARLTVALTEADAAEAASAATVTPASVAAAPTSRRRWMAAFGSALTATAAGAAFLIWRNRQPREEMTREQFLDEMLVFHQRTAGEAGGARILTQSGDEADRRLLEQLPLSRTVVPQDRVRWRKFDETSLGRSGIAYELARPGGPRAVLYVMADDRGLPIAELPKDEPDRAPATTGGCALGAWREAGRLAILVVDGDAGRYEQFLVRPQIFA
jgi:hypothetical protein